MTSPGEPTVLSFEDIEFSPTACLFEGGPRAGVGVSMFITQTRPGGFVELHVHPYPETFVLLRGQGRWTAGDQVVDLEANQLIVVPANTPHGLRNVGTEPLLIVSVHESERLQQTMLGREPA
jgi:mannose-6-phosphate isomerase-like protein (cupin superfamily)